MLCCSRNKLPANCVVNAHAFKKSNHGCHFDWLLQQHIKLYVVPGGPSFLKNLKLKKMYNSNMKLIMVHASCVSLGQDF